MTAPYDDDYVRRWQAERRLPPTPAPTTADLINDVCSEVRDLLLDKNAAYGDSAIRPLRLFSKANAEEQLLVRIDDKVSRLARGHEYPGDDTVTDLAGYLLLLLVARRSPTDTEDAA